MDTIPTLSEQEIRKYVGATNFQRGLQYWHNGAISDLDMRRQGMTLKVRCEGSQGDIYYVQATFDTRGISSSDCSCASDDGRCKHVAALLVAWREQPEDFTEQEPLEVTLEHYHKDELIALIQQIVVQQPALEWSMDALLGTLGGGFQRRITLDLEMYRRQVQALFRCDVYKWGAYYEIARELRKIEEVADDYRKKQDYVNAAALYDVILLEVLQYYDPSLDTTDKLGDVIFDCTASLEKCLAAEKDNHEIRETILKALATAYYFFARYEDYTSIDSIPDTILGYTTAQERQRLAEWIRKEMPARHEWDDGFDEQDEYDEELAEEEEDALLADLESDKLDDETFLQHYRAAGRFERVVARLLERGRKDEAEREVEQVLKLRREALDERVDAFGFMLFSPYIDLLLRIANVFVDHKQETFAEQLVLGLTADFNREALRWLIEYYKTHQQYDKALEQLLYLFRHGPLFENYKEMQQIAEALGRWETVKADLLAFLQADTTRNAFILIQIALEDQQIDRALDLLEANKRSFESEALMSDAPMPDIELAVANAAEETRPTAALAIYRRRAEELIRQRGRDNYAEASHLLIKMRTLYVKTGGQAIWAAYIAKLREQNRRLTALKDELNKAGL